MRVLLALKNTNISNLDNSENDSVNNEADSNEGNISLVDGEIIVQQNLSVGLTVEVPLRGSCRQQKQNLTASPSECIGEPEVAASQNISLAKVRTVDSSTNIAVVSCEQKADGTPPQHSEFSLSEIQQQVYRRSRKRPIFSATASSLSYAQFNSITASSEATSFREYRADSPIERSTSLVNQHLRRSKPDSKPAAKAFVDGKNLLPDRKVTTQSRISSHSTMAGGGRRRFDSDDDSVETNEPWIGNNRPGKRSHHRHASVKLLLSPAENEPPSLEISTARESVATRSSTDTEIRTSPENDSPSSQLTCFCLAIKKLGLEVVEQEGDGNCLFRAISLQVYGHADHHAEVRERCMDFMASNEEHYSNFVAVESDEGLGSESFEDYIYRKRQLGVHGNHAEIQAVSELFNRPVEVYTANEIRSCDKLEPINIFHAEYKTSEIPIRLSYHDGNHYNAIIDPLCPTAGLGLGLPGLQPGLADKLQVAAAVTESDRLADEIEFNRVLQESAKGSQHWAANDEDDDLQRALKESSYSVDMMYEKKALALSDLDATNFELEQEALAESWDLYGRQEQCRKKQASSTSKSGQRRPRSDLVSLSLPTFSESSSSVAAIPAPCSEAETIASASSPAAAAPCRSQEDAADDPSVEYPHSVQELAINGFELKRVVRAYELVGDNFDDMLSFLLSTAERKS